MNYDVFISYSRKDSAVADEICEALDREKISYFIDRQGIEGGFEFPVVLAEAILNSKVVLFLASKNSYESKFTNSELTFAFNEKPKNTILPYIIDGSMMPPGLRLVFSSVNWRTIENNPIEPNLMNDLRNMIAIERGETENIAISEPTPTEEFDPVVCKVAFEMFENNSPQISFVQMRFSFGFAKAMRIVDKLVSIGVIGKQGNMSKFLVNSRDELESLLVKTGVLRRFKVGDLFNAQDKLGVVFAVDESGISGKIIALEETAGRYSWYDNKGRICRLGHFDFNDGALNSDIVTKQKEWYKQYPAFAACLDNGPDWYLPSLNEMKTIFENKEILSAGLERGGGDPFRYGWGYWTSSKNPQDEAISVSMKTGYESYSHDHTKLCYVRPVSKF